MSKVYPTINEIKIAVTNPLNSFKESSLKQGNPIKKGIRVIQYTGGFSTVFPFNVKNKKKALRIWTSEMEESKDRTDIINDYLNKFSSQYFVKFKYHKEAILIKGNYYPIIIMDWVNGCNLRQYIEDNLKNNAALIKLADNFVELVSFLHSKGISHGDLQHGNIMITKEDKLVLVDYDSLFVPGMEQFNDNIKGLPGYQHPKRNELKKLSPKSDYFSELVIYLSILSYANDQSLWREGTEHLLFSEEDLFKPKDSKVFKKLLKSKNDKIRDLSNQLINFLQIDHIDKLSPIDDLLIDKKKKLLDEFDETFGKISKVSIKKAPQTKKPKIDGFDFDFSNTEKKVSKAKKPSINDFDF
jgi:serine/threonine protein kinase